MYDPSVSLPEKHLTQKARHMNTIAIGMTTVYHMVPTVVHSKMRGEKREMGMK